MFDLFLGLQRAFEGGVQDEADIMGCWPPFRDFWFLLLCNGYGDIGPWAYPCLGPIL
jgi:hypothetical protein